MHYQNQDNKENQFQEVILNDIYLITNKQVIINHLLDLKTKIGVS